MKEMRILSRFSDEDGDSCINGIFVVRYSDDKDEKDVKKEIIGGYRYLQENGMMISSDLSLVLDYLEVEGKIIRYRYDKHETFDCDCGMFEEE